MYTFKFYLKTGSITLIMVEILLRSLGYEPHQKFELDEIKCNGIVWNIPYDSIGYVFNSGKFDCLVNDKLNFTATHNNDLSRKTREVNSNCKKTIHLYGDSFIWGQSLDDSQTMAWLLQDMNKKICIKNFGVGAYSSIQSFLLFKNNLKKNHIPEEVFLFYSGFLDDRNAFTSTWKNLWQDLLQDLKESGEYKDNLSNEFYMPIGEIQNNNFQIEYLNEKMINASVPLRRSLAMMNVIDIILNNYEDKKKKSHLVSKELFKEFFTFSKARNIKFTLVIISKNSLNQNEIKTLNEFGIPIIDISFELSLDKHTFHPIDMHPNEVANKVWANKLSKYIN